jgi:hypothetical protein
MNKEAEEIMRKGPQDRYCRNKCRRSPPRERANCYWKCCDGKCNWGLELELTESKHLTEIALDDDDDDSDEEYADEEWCD